ncbi:hypothetical protein IMCC1989_2470 [gamma proteobacterium IMCC1989]|nr:hypothetical protein IMCC1989_2470 [gamma proteobacterium IMCC1989]
MKILSLQLVIFIGLTFIDTELGWRFLGCCLLVIGLMAIHRKKVTFEFETGDSIFEVRGFLAVFLGFIMFLVGITVAVDPAILDGMFGLCNGSCEKMLR